MIKHVELAPLNGDCEYLQKLPVKIGLDKDYLGRVAARHPLKVVKLMLLKRVYNLIDIGLNP